MYTNQNNQRTILFAGFRFPKIDKRHTLALNAKMEETKLTPSLDWSPNDIKHFELAAGFFVIIPILLTLGIWAENRRRAGKVKN